MRGFAFSIKKEVSMNNTKTKQFAEALLSIEPDYPMTVDEITEKIELQGIDSLFANANVRTSTLLEVIYLLKNLEKRAREYES